MNSFRRTDFDALSTVDARILVDDCEVVFDLDGVDGAGAHTTATGDAPDLAGVREKMEKADIPEFMQGLPITLMAASVVSVSFMGFKGVIENLFG
jgi:Na+-transporting NADH:ubiquinone oxidoreductase subunit NqrE